MLFYGRASPAFELYDLQADPNELTNIAALPQHAETVRSLVARLEGALRVGNDELLSGIVTSKKPSPVVPQWVRPEGSERFRLHYDRLSETEEIPFPQ